MDCPHGRPDPEDCKFCRNDDPGPPPGTPHPAQIDYTAQDPT